MRKSTLLLFLVLPAFAGGLAAAEERYEDRGQFYGDGTWSQQSPRYDRHVRDVISREDRVNLGYTDGVDASGRTDLSSDRYATILGKQVERFTKSELNERLGDPASVLTAAGAKIAQMTRAMQEKRVVAGKRWTEFFGDEAGRAVRQNARRAANEGGVKGRLARKAKDMAAKFAGFKDTDEFRRLVSEQTAARLAKGKAEQSSEPAVEEPKPTATDVKQAVDPAIVPGEPVVEEPKPTATVVDTAPKVEPVAVPTPSKKRGWGYKADQKRHKAGSPEATALLAKRVTPEEGTRVMNEWDAAAAERQKATGKKLKGDFFRNSSGKRASAKAEEAEEQSFLERTGDYYLNPTDADGKAYEGSDKNWARGRRVGAATADALAVTLAGYGIATNKLIPIDILFEKGIVSPTSTLGKILRNRFVRGGITLSLLAFFMEMTGLVTGKGGHYGPVTGSVRMLRDWHQNRNAPAIAA
ncbi:MAG: hypothetical protein QG604_311 [Candidatus Dependentiae bacterium]|nr:hypothetical protein [Candidatus Dependentiae bacterium]